MSYRRFPDARHKGGVPDHSRVTLSRYPLARNSAHFRAASRTRASGYIGLPNTNSVTHHNRPRQTRKERTTPHNRRSIPGASNTKLGHDKQSNSAHATASAATHPRNDRPRAPHGDRSARNKQKRENPPRESNTHSRGGLTRPSGLSPQLTTSVSDDGDERQRKPRHHRPARPQRHPGYQRQHPS